MTGNRMSEDAYQDNEREFRDEQEIRGASRAEFDPIVRMANRYFALQTCEIFDALAEDRKHKIVRRFSSIE